MRKIEDGKGVYASDPGWKRLDRLFTDYAIAKNPQVWFHLADPANEERMTYTEEQRLAVVDEIRNQMTVALGEEVIPPVFETFIEEQARLLFDNHMTSLGDQPGDQM